MKSAPVTSPFPGHPAVEDEIATLRGIRFGSCFPFGESVFSFDFLKR